jgi:hypothetical protein
MATYTDYKLTADGDRAIENSAFVLVEDADVIKQQMETNMKLSKKDWFLNFDEGIQYFNTEDTNEDDGILGAREITTAHEGQLQAAAENTIGVISLNSFEYDLLTTSLIVRIEALTEFGDVTLETVIEV